MGWIYTKYQSGLATCWESRRAFLVVAVAVPLLAAMLVVVTPAPSGATTIIITDPTALLGSFQEASATNNQGQPETAIAMSAALLNVIPGPVYVDGVETNPQTPLPGATIDFSVEDTTGMWWPVCTAVTDSIGIASCVNEAPYILIYDVKTYQTIYAWSAVFAGQGVNGASSDYGTIPGVAAPTGPPPTIQTDPIRYVSGCNPPNPDDLPTLGDLLTDGGNCQLVHMENVVTTVVVLAATAVLTGGFDLIEAAGEIAAGESLLDSTFATFLSTSQQAAIQASVDAGMAALPAASVQLGAAVAAAAAPSYGVISIPGFINVPSQGTFSVAGGNTVDNTGTIVNTGTITDADAQGNGAGTIDNTGTIINDGTINTIGGLTITGNNYTLNFDLNGGQGSTPVALDVLAPTVDDSQQSLPTPATPAGEAFTGWYTQPSGGTLVNNDTDLSTMLPTGPSSTTLYAQFVSTGATTTSASPESVPYSGAAQNASLAATVTSGLGTVNEGTMSFSVVNASGATVGAGITAPVVNGSASTVYPLPAGAAAGSYSIDAAYSDSANTFVASSDDSHSLTIAPAPTAVVTGPLSVAYSGSAQTVTPDVQVASAAGTVNEGTVTFSLVNSSGQTVATDPSGTVSGGWIGENWTIPGGLPSGTYSVDAAYSDPGGNLAGSSNVDGTLLSQSVTFPTPPQDEAVGDLYYMPEPTSTSGSLVTPSIDTSSGTTCDLYNYFTSGFAIVAFDAPGTCRIDATIPSVNGYAAASGFETIPVAQYQDVVTFPSPPSNPTVGTTFTLPTLSSASGVPVTDWIDASSAQVCTLSNGVVSLNAVGSCQIDATTPNSANYLGADDNDTISVLPDAQNIYFSGAPASPVVGGTYQVSTASDSGAAVSLSIDPTSSGVCSITGTTVTFTGPGDCTIDGSVPASGNYAAATSSQSFAVDEPQTISFSTPPASPVVGGTYQVSASSTSGSAVSLSIDASSTGVCSLANGTVTFAGVGSCEIDGSVPASGYYPAATASQSLTVGQAPQNIYFSAPPASPVVGATYEVSATSDSGNPVSFGVDPSSASVCFSGGDTVDFTSVGACEIDASVAGSANYLPATASQTIDVQPGPQNIYFSTPPASPVVGGTYQVSATSDSGVSVSLSVDPSTTSVCSLAGGTVTFLAVGSCEIDGSVSASGNYAAETASQIVVVGPKSTPSPTVGSVSPSSGTILGGTPIKITGTGFLPGDHVVINKGNDPGAGAISATNVVVVSPTEITAVTGGAATAGSYNVFVIGTGNQTSPASKRDTFTYTNPPAPTVSAVAPNSGNISGGTPIEITGTGFLPGDHVVFTKGSAPGTGAIPASNVVVVSPTEITAVTGGAATAGSYNVRVIGPGSTSSKAVPADKFTYKGSSHHLASWGVADASASLAERKLVALWRWA